jgi:hypothetical protein
MGIQIMVPIHNELLFSYKEEWNYIICKKMDRTGDHLVEEDNPNAERQILHILSHMWNVDLRNKSNNRNKSWL